MVITIIAVLAAMLLPAIKMVREGALTMRCLAHVRQFYLAAEAYANDNDGSLAPCSDAAPSGGNCLWPTLLNPYLEAAADSGGANPTYNGSITKKNLAWGCPNWLGRNTGAGIATSSSGYGYNKYPGLPTPIGTPTRNNSLGDMIFSLAGITNRSSRLMFCDSNDWHQWSAPSPTNYPTRAVSSVSGPWVGIGGMRHRNGINIAFFDGHAGTVPLTTVANTFSNPAAFQ